MPSLYTLTHIFHLLLLINTITIIIIVIIFIKSSSPSSSSSSSWSIISEPGQCINSLGLHHLRTPSTEVWPTQGSYVQVKITMMRMRMMSPAPATYINNHHFHHDHCTVVCLTHLAGWLQPRQEGLKSFMLRGTYVSNILIYASIIQVKHFILVMHVI